MEKVIANVRGSLGGQLACYLAARAKGPVDSIVLNVGGKIQNESRYSYLPDIIQNCPDVRLSNGMEKAELTAASVILAAYNQALQTHVARTADFTDDSILHIRLGDRQCTSDETYEALKDSGEFDQVLGSMNGLDQAVDDWFRLLWTKEVTASVSWFAITAAMMAPTMQLTLLEPDGPIPMNDRSMAALRYAIDSIPNIQWRIP